MPRRSPQGAGGPVYTHRAKRSSFGSARHGMKFVYVYILQSEAFPERFYSGFTEDLQLRLTAHNHGCCEATKPFRPWRIKTAVAFSDRSRALDFERYLKTGSGRAFCKKRL